MHSGVDLLVCPPFAYLFPVSEIVKGTPVALGAQNMYHAANGAFTGETSAAMLLDAGCSYVILGHSERRHILGETDADVNKKTLAALAAGLTPIVCVGELLDRARSGRNGRCYPPSVRWLAGRRSGRPDRTGDYRLRAGVGHRHRESGHSRRRPRRFMLSFAAC